MKEREERQPRQPPVKQGDLIEVDIIGIGKEGDGVGKFEGFVIIVPKAKTGERHEVEITKVMQRLAFGEIVNR